MAPGWPSLLLRASEGTTAAGASSEGRRTPASGICGLGDGPTLLFGKPATAVP